ncbi:MAG: Gldg family protein [Myxococcota bacterium]
MRIHKLWPSWLLLVSLTVVFAGERIFAAENTIRITLAVMALIGFAVAGFVRTMEWAQASAASGVEDRKSVLMLLLTCTAGIIVSMLLYALIPLVFNGVAPSVERTRGILWVLWPIVLALSGLVLLFVETAVASVAYIDRYEHAQIRRATVRGLSLALFLSSLFVGNYLAVRHDTKLELGAAASAVATDQTRTVVRDLTEKVKVVLFFPKANDVAARVEQYFNPLRSLNPNLEIEQVDHALASEMAEKAQVTENGYVALYRDNTNEKIRVGLEYRIARSSLRRFDYNFVKALIRVTTKQKVAYFYTGHDELAFNPRKDDTRGSLRNLKKQLEAWQYKIKPFSVGEGSTTALPKDGDVLFIVGPEKAFLPAEIEVLKASLKKGVRLFIALESERTGDALEGLLNPMGLSFDKTPLVAPSSHLPLTRTRADFRTIYSNQFSTHPSVTTMTRNTGKVAAIFQKAGSLTAKDDTRLKGIKTNIVLTARGDTFADTNDNLTLDPGEKRSKYGLAAAVTVTATTANKKDEGRIFVVSDADVLADDLFNLLPGNVYFLLDVIRWLQREAEVIVPTSSETDVKIVHKGTEDAVVFYGTTVAIPALILFIGAFATRRRRRS